MSQAICAKGNKKPKRQRQIAKNPKGVLQKVQESRFFLDQVAGHENDSNPEVFFKFVSAFLNSFRTIGNRLCGVTKHKYGKDKANSVHEQLTVHPEIGFLIEQRDIEVHEDGAAVFKRFAVHAADPVPQVVDRYTNRFASRFGSRHGHGLGIRYTGGWQFGGNPKNLIELGHDALDAIETIVEQTLA